MKLRNILLFTFAIVSTSCNFVSAQSNERISPDLSSSDIVKYKQDLKLASDASSACYTRYRMVRGIPYDQAIHNFISSTEYCGSPEDAVETLCTMYRGKKVDWLAFGLGDRQVNDKYCY